MARNKRAGRGRGIHVRTRRAWAIERIEAAILNELALAEARLQHIKRIADGEPTESMWLMMEHMNETKQLLRGIAIHLVAYEVNNHDTLASL